MKESQLLKVIIVSFVVTLGLLGLAFYFGFKQPRLGGDFTLNHRGSPWSFSQNSKSLNVLYVGYAKCPDVCPLSLSVAGQTFRNLQEKELSDINFVFVSVDHENDTAENVANYASQFFSSFVGLTGTKEQIDQLVDQFGTSYVVDKNTKSQMGYLIGHADRFYFLDSKGYVKDTLSNPRDHKKVLQKIRKNL